MTGTATGMEGFWQGGRASGKGGLREGRLSFDREGFREAILSEVRAPGSEGREEGGLVGGREGGLLGVRAVGWEEYFGDAGPPGRRAGSRK